MKEFWVYAFILTFPSLYCIYIHMLIMKAYFDLCHWNRILQSFFSLTYEILWQEYNWIFSACCMSYETSRRENQLAIHFPVSMLPFLCFKRAVPCKILYWTFTGFLKYSVPLLYDILTHTKRFNYKKYVSIKDCNKISHYSYMSTHTSTSDNRNHYTLCGKLHNHSWS